MSLITDRLEAAMELAEHPEPYDKSPAVVAECLIVLCLLELRRQSRHRRFEAKMEGMIDRLVATVSHGASATAGDGMSVIVGAEFPPGIIPCPLCRGEGCPGCNGQGVVMDTGHPGPAGDPGGKNPLDTPTAAAEPPPATNG